MNKMFLLAYQQDSYTYTVKEFDSLVELLNFLKNNRYIILSKFYICNVLFTETSMMDKLLDITRFVDKPKV